MRSRLTLHTKLCTILGNTHVYYQPPESVKLYYPCIIYELSDVSTFKNDDTSTPTHKLYTIKHIYKDVDDELIDEMITRFQYCSFNRRFIADNLYHDVFELYY